MFHSTITALAMCSFGAAPTPLLAIPVGRGMFMFLPGLNFMDNKPFLNVMPFGVCSSMANPMVAAATAAALGVLSPMPCIPMTALAPWVPFLPTVFTGKMPAINMNSKLICMWGGIIQQIFPGQVKVIAK